MVTAAIVLAVCAIGAPAAMADANLNATIATSTGTLTPPGSVGVQYCANNTTPPASEKPSNDRLTLHGKVTAPGGAVLDKFVIQGVEPSGNSLCTTKTYDFTCSSTPGSYTVLATANSAAGSSFQATKKFRVRACPGAVPLQLTSACTPFDDFIFYGFQFGAGATPGLSSLSYTYTRSSDSAQSTGTVTSSTTNSTGGTFSVRSENLDEPSSGTYTFEFRIEIDDTPGTLQVSDGTHNNSVAVPDGQSVSEYCAEP